MRLVRVNVDEEPGLSARYGVLSLPTVILFAGGEPKATVVWRAVASAVRARVQSVRLTGLIRSRHGAHS